MTPEESEAAWDEYFRQEFQMSDQLHREIDEWVDGLTKDWPPPDSPEQLRVLRKYFGPRLHAGPAIEKVTSARTVVELRAPATYALPLLERLETRRRAGFVGPTLTEAHLERFVDTLLSTQFAC